MTDSTLAHAAQSFGALAQELTAELPNPRSVAQVRDDVASLLAGQSEIRMFIDGTKNLGHQAASLRLLERLLDVTQFKGDVVVLYADYGRAILGDTAQKIAFLLSQTEMRSLDSYSFVAFNGAQIRFIPYENRRSVPGRVRFGFSGGADDMGINYAAELCVDWFLRLQPFLWDDGPGQKLEPYYESSRIESLDNRMLYLVDAWPPLRDLPLKSVDKSLTNASTARPQDVELYERLDRSGYVVWPVYGLHHFGPQSEVIAFNLVNAAHVLSAHLGRPIAVVSFCPLVHDLSESPLLGALVKGKSHVDSAMDLDIELHKYDQATEFATSLGTVPDRPRFDFVHPDEIRSKDNLRHYRTGQVGAIWLQSGPVAPNVFEHILSKSTFPPVIEGQSTANWLLNLGRPYIHMLRAEHVIKNGYVSGIASPGTSELASQMNAVVQRITTPSALHQPDQATVAEDLANLVLRMTNSSSNEARYFLNFREWLADDVHDKLFLGLVALHCAAQERGKEFMK